MLGKTEVRKCWVKKRSYKMLGFIDSFHMGLVGCGNGLASAKNKALRRSFRCRDLSPVSGWAGGSSKKQWNKRRQRVGERVAGGSEWDWEGVGGSGWERLAGGSEWDWVGVGGSRWQRVAGGSE